MSNSIIDEALPFHTDEKPTGTQPAWIATIKVVVPCLDDSGSPVDTQAHAQDFVSESLRNVFLDWGYDADLHPITVCKPYVEGSAFHKKRIIATFQPQMWARNGAIDVGGLGLLDPEGETTWDVTDVILAMPRAKALALRDNKDETDSLRDGDSVPTWIRQWPGPYYVKVEESIRDYFDGKLVAAKLPGPPEPSDAKIAIRLHKTTARGDVASAVRDVAEAIDRGDNSGDLALCQGMWSLVNLVEHDSERIIYVVGYCPGVQGGVAHDGIGDGGFEWRKTRKEIHNVITYWLTNDEELRADYTIRAVQVPEHVNLDKRDDVTDWLDHDGFDLWNTTAQKESES